MCLGDATRRFLQGRARAALGTSHRRAMPGRRTNKRWSHHTWKSGGPPPSRPICLSTTSVPNSSLGWHTAGKSRFVSTYGHAWTGGVSAEEGRLSNKPIIPSSKLASSLESGKSLAMGK